MNPYPRGDVRYISTPDEDIAELKAVKLEELKKFYDEFYAHAMTRKEWDRVVLGSEMMNMFRTTMFKRIIPNLKRIGLLSDRVRPHYEQYGLLAFEHGRAAPELTAQDLIDDAA